MSIAELNAEIEKGAIVHEDGTVEVIAPTEPESTVFPTETESEPIPLVTDEPTNDESAETDELTVDVSADADEEESQKMNVTPFVIGAIAIVLVASAFVAIKRKKAYQARLNEEEVNEE